MYPLQWYMYLFNHINPLMVHVGSSLYNQLEMMKERVVIVISADLAHTHQKSGPYGYSNASEPYDKVSSKSVCQLNNSLKLFSGTTTLVCLGAHRNARKHTTVFHFNFD